MSAFVPLDGQEPEEELEHIEVSTAFDELDKEFVDGLIDKIVLFCEALSGHKYYEYQKGAARRIVESVVIRDAEVITALASRQALDVNTPILGPNGWSTMGHLQVGDEVFAPDGTVTRVKDVSDTFTDAPCYLVRLSDGRSLVADEQHRWYVLDRQTKKHLFVTTADLVRGYLSDNTDRFTYRYAIRVGEALDLPEQDLPIDPYILGVWLGDGSSYKAEITTADEEILWAFRNAGYESTYEYNRGAATTYGFKSLFPALRDLGLIKGSSGGSGKSIPHQYLYAGTKQRLALLQGLMDTDGYCGKVEAEFCSTSPYLAEGVLFLARSLGWKVTMKVGRATLNGRDCGPKYRVCWTPYADSLYVPFRLSRKVQAMRHSPDQAWRIHRTMSANVVGVEEVASRPTRCIAVEHPSEMFLAGPDLVPTANSGKSELVANTVAGLMVILPRLARMFPKLLGVYKDGFWVGLFAPVEGQVETLYSRIVARLTSERALEILADPEVDDKIKRISGVTRGLRLEKSGSYCTMMTANPKAKVESKTYHLIVLDEAQESDDVMVSKSLAPMLAHYKGTMVKLGTPSFTKNNFYKSIQLNRRLQTRRGARQNHYEWTWKEVVQEVPDYGDFIKKEMLRIGEDSDEFQMSYQAKFILERGMFVTQTQMDELADVSMETVKAYHNTPVVVGIDPARKQDSTVVTVVYVDWDRPDEFGYFHHRVLNWLEIQGDDWEAQYHQIVDFLGHYNVLAIGVDANGVGDAVAQRLALLIPRAEVIPLTSSQQEQSDRFKHLQALIQRGQIAWPGNAKARRLRTWKRFMQQMTDAEKDFKGSNFLVHAPDEPHAHDDYVDSLAIACALTKDATMPKIQISSSPFFP